MIQGALEIDILEIFVEASQRGYRDPNFALELDKWRKVKEQNNASRWGREMRNGGKREGGR